MRNCVVAFTLLLFIPLGLLLATRGARVNTSTLVTHALGEIWQDGSSPSVQYTAGVKGWDEDPLIAPIFISEPADVHPISQALDFTLGERAHFHPHGEQVCASGCAASRHPTETLTRYRFNRLLREYANEPIDGAGPAQDALLYFGRQAAQLLATEGAGGLEPVRTAVLKHELARNHAEIEIRVVDALDHVRASLPATDVPLDRRHEFELDTHRLQPMIASGTVKRVGRDFLWTRL